MINSDSSISHEWGQSRTALFNEVVSVFDQNDVDSVILDTRKKFGAKSLQAFFEEQGLVVEVVGRRGEGGRQLQVSKPSGAVLQKIESEEALVFSFNDHDYSVFTGEALFSKKGLDDGSRYLLDIALAKLGDKLDGSQVADFGCGWGALSVVLQENFPGISLTLLDNDQASLDAARRNIDPQIAQILRVDIASSSLDMPGRFDIIISNPPFHITDSARRQLFSNIKMSLRPGGELLFVVEKHFAERFIDSASAQLKKRRQFDQGKFSVLRYKRLS